MALDWTNRINGVDDADANDPNLLAAAIIDLEDGKVDKITGKGLSTNDYTTTEKEKLSELENYDDTAVRTDISNLQSGLGAVIQGKQDKEAGKGLSTNDYTTAEKEKLATAVTFSNKIGQYLAGIVAANDLFYATDAISDYGYIIATIKSYADYIAEQPPLSENAFISVGTLRNVITGTIESNKLVPVISTPAASTTAYTLDMATSDNTDIRLGVCTNPLLSLTIAFSNGVYDNNFALSINFNSGTTPTDISYTNTGIINWVGTDCELQSGVSTFTPQANKHYEVMIWFNGTDFTGSVIGYEQANSNPVSDTTGIEPDEPTPNPSELEFE